MGCWGGAGAGAGGGPLLSWSWWRGCGECFDAGSWRKKNTAREARPSVPMQLQVPR